LSLAANRIVSVLPTRAVRGVSTVTTGGIVSMPRPRNAIRTVPDESPSLSVPFATSRSSYGSKTTTTPRPAAVALKPAPDALACSARTFNRCTEAPPSWTDPKSTDTGTGGARSSPAATSTALVMSRA
jgi:hypothetical protein